MIPTPKDLREIARLKEGSLRDVPFAVLLHALGTEERTAVLELRRHQLEKRIVLEDGVPTDCRSNLLHETFGKFLVHRGKLTEEQYQHCLAESASTSTAITDVLLKRELISAFEIFKLLQQNLASMLLDAFTWRSGQFRLHGDVPAVESPLKVKVPQLVFTGITRFTPQAAVDEEIAPLVGTPLAIHPAAAGQLAALKLNAHHARLTSLLKQRLRVDELGAQARLPPEELVRVLYALAVLGVVVPADQVPVPVEAPAPRTPTAPPAAPAPVPAAPPTPVADAVPGPTPAQLERTRNDVTRAYLAHRKQDAFELLGAPEDATPAVLRLKFLEFSRRYAPWKFEDGELAGLADKAEDLFLAGARAFALLSDAEQRNSLIYRRRNPPAEPKGNPAAYFAIKTDLLDPAKHFQQGLSRMAAGKYAEALQMLEFAADCDPRNGAYQAELAYCRFLLSPSQAPQFLKDLQAALRMDPECGVAVYYTGVLHKARGNTADAESHFRRAAKMLPGDRRPTEALKLLVSTPKH